MSVLAWIVAGGLLMSALALVGGVTLLLDPRTQERLVRPLVAFAAGSLLGGALLHMIPEAALASVSLVSSANPAYGLNSLGGALAMSTRSGLDSPGVTADLSYGSGSRKRAAEVMGVDRRTITRMVERYGLKAEDGGESSADG